jgi:hypothetical protein
MAASAPPERPASRRGRERRGLGPLLTWRRRLYEQMIGRGLREPTSGGTSQCLVIDVLDNIRFDGQMVFTRCEEYWTNQGWRCCSTALLW